MNDAPLRPRTRIVSGARPRDPGLTIDLLANGPAMNAAFTLEEPGIHQFLTNNRDQLIDRCRAKVALRSKRATSPEQLALGVPLFLEQLVDTMRAEVEGADTESYRISGDAGGDAEMLSTIGASASAHGKVLLELGFSLDQVVHDYGDLCQAITDLAVERDAPFSVNEFRTLNRCLDNAIASAVTGFAEQRDASVALENCTEEKLRLGFLVHELRNQLQTATSAFSALEAGKLAIGGSTAGLVKRSLASLEELLTQSLSTVKGGLAPDEVAVKSLIEDASGSASFYARTSGCTLTVPSVDPFLLVSGNRMRLVGAVVNLLQNAFKFTRPHTEILLTAGKVGDRVVISVRDHCGGLPAGASETLFNPFTQVGGDRGRLGLGLSIARQDVETAGGTLSVADVPGSGCIFTIDLPLCMGDRNS